MEIRLASGCKDYTACQRFWYSVYVEEMGRHVDDSRYTCHKTRTLSDPHIDSANLFLAWEGDEVVGSMLTVYARHGTLGEYAPLYGMNRFASEQLSSASISKKLMVRPDKRKSSLAVKLGIAAYTQGYIDGMRWNLIDCNEHMIPFFTALGYTAHRGWVAHPVYGRVYCMRLAMDDLHYLRELRSPLGPVLKRLRTRAA